MKLLRVALFLCVIFVAAFGQGSGAVTGILTDSSGAVVPGVPVSLRNLSTGVVSNTVTSDAGLYNFPAVPIGTYELRVETAGFKAYVQTNIVVETGQAARRDVQLQLGSTQESVSVTSEAPLLSQETSAAGTQVKQTMLNRLPFQLSGAMRNPFAFLRLTPGATGASSSAGDTRIAGGRALAAEFFVDGVQLTYNASQSVADVSNPPYDIIAEFRVEAVIPSAEHGRTSGGIVLMSTRSGTNQYHGNILGLFRNNIFDARRYNARIADISRQSEFAGSLGGPILIPKLYNGRNRTFFFGNYTGFRRLSEAQGGTATVATAAMRNGDFSANREQIFDPLTADGTGRRQQFPGNIIPASRVSAHAKAVTAAVPLPNAAGLAQNYIGSNRSGENSDAGFVRVDHQIADPHRVSLSYRHQNRFRQSNNGALPKLDEVIDGPDTRNFTIGEDWIAKPNLVNRFQYGFTYFKNNRQETIANLGLKVAGAFSGGLPATTFSGQGMSQLGYDQSRTPTNFNWDLGDSLSWTHGSHNMKFGVRYDQYITNFRPRQNEAGTYNFSQFATSQPQVSGTGHSYASFLLGLVNSASLAKALAQKDQSRYFATYAQDDWKITRRLTLNYGLRWEFQAPWHEPEGRVSIMDPTVPNPGASGRPGALIFAGDGAGRLGGRNFMLTDLDNFSPRFGFAYQLTSRTVIRSGYAIMYAPLIGQDENRQGFNANIGLSTTDGGLTPAFQIDQGWPAGVVKAPPFIDPTVANGQTTSMIEKRRGGSGSMPRTQQWQLNIQQTVRGVLVEASYVATVGHGITNNALVQVNQLAPDYLRLGSLLTRNIADSAVVAAGYTRPYAGFNGTLAQSLRAFPQYLGVTTLDAPTGNSTYHALFLKSEKRFSNGLQFLLSYSLSKTLTDVAFDGGDLSGPQDQFNRRAEKSIANIDIPNRLVISYSYELPFGKGKRWLSGRAADYVLGGWSIAGIHTYQGGGPLRISNPNNLPIFNGHLRPNRVAGVPISIGRGRGDFQPLNGLTGQQGDLYLNRSAFATPDPFTFGNLGVFLPDVRAFGSRNEDISLVKRFRLRESLSTEFRGDFFNIFNRRNLSSAVTDLTNPNFGRISGQGAARIVQLGWRLDF
ncbi:MAG: TonB-dependent receptor [Acidobacteria bacterium]|nr:TonB-dependent receptor [Acidobacteriota bacterium]